MSSETAGSSLAPALVLGVGLGGFLDGIVLHQLLQWHHMLSDVPESPVTTVAGLEANTVADGLFHIAAWLCVVYGIFLMVHAWRIGRPARAWAGQVGLLMIGWGAFNVVEGIVDHHLLGVHHVRDDLGGPLSWDMAYLGFSLVLVIVGGALTRRGSGVPDPSTTRAGGAPDTSSQP